MNVKASSLPKMKRPNYFCLFFIIVSFVGCWQRNSDTNQARATTAQNLNRWEFYIKLCRQYVFPIEKCESINDAVALLKAHKFLDLKGDDVALKVDYWGRKYHWLVTTRENEIGIRIVSTGRNGVFENGVGDDLFFEMILPKRGEILVRPAVW